MLKLLKPLKTIKYRRQQRHGERQKKDQHYVTYGDPLKQVLRTSHSFQYEDKSKFGISVAVAKYSYLAVNGDRSRLEDKLGH